MLILSLLLSIILIGGCKNETPEIKAVDPIGGIYSATDTPDNRAHYIAEGYAVCEAKDKFCVESESFWRRRRFERKAEDAALAELAKERAARLAH